MILFWREIIRSRRGGDYGQFFNLNHEDKLKDLQTFVHDKYFSCTLRTNKSKVDIAMKNMIKKAYGLNGRYLGEVE